MKDTKITQNTYLSQYIRFLPFFGGPADARSLAAPAVATSLEEYKNFSTFH